MWPQLPPCLRELLAIHHELRGIKEIWGPGFGNCAALVIIHLLFFLSAPMFLVFQVLL